MAVSWQLSVFQKLVFWPPPPFLQCFGVRAFWAKLSKEGNVDPTPKKENLTDNWKAQFWECYVFSFLFLFFWGFKGQVRWPKGPPHLALNPPYLIFSFFFGGGGGGFLFEGFLVFCFFFFVCFGVVFGFRTKTCFPPTKGIFFCLFFSVSLWFSLAFSPLSLSLSVSLSLSLSFLLVFLSSLLVPLFFLSCFLLVPCFFFVFFCLFALFLCFCFMKRTTSKYHIRKFFCHQSFHFLGGFLSCFVFQVPFPYLCVFSPDFKLCFLFNINVFLQTRQVNKKNSAFWSRGGLQ